MNKPIVLLLATVLALAGCSSDTKDNRAAPTSSAAVASAAPTPEPVTATVISDRGCNDKRPFGCWLPLGATPTHDDLLSPKPINMSVVPGSPCDDKTALQGCWPQPGDEVKVACLQLVNGEAWVAVIVPFKSVVNKAQQATAYGEGFLGWNRAQYVSLPKAPATCPN